MVFDKIQSLCPDHFCCHSRKLHKEPLPLSHSHLTISAFVATVVKTKVTWVKTKNLSRIIVARYKCNRILVPTVAFSFGLTEGNTPNDGFRPPVCSKHRHLHMVGVNLWFFSAPLLARFAPIQLDSWRFSTPGSKTVALDR